MIRQLIREMLLTEKVYGAQAVVYHGSKTAPEVFIPALLNDTFNPGQGHGAMYGKGLYCVYDLGTSLTRSGYYGDYLYKFKVNLYGFICFDPEVAQLVYKRPLTPVEQAQELGLDKVLIEKLKTIHIKTGFTSEPAVYASEFLRGKVKGLIFTGSHDGQAAVIYDQTVAVPFAWQQYGDKSWTAVDVSSLKPALRKSASGDWKAEKYDIDYEALLAKLSKLPADKRITKGDFNLSYSGITSLPAGLKVGGNFDLSYSSITSLPADLQVGGNLNVIRTKITSLPADLQVGGNLELFDAKITSLPADLKVGGNLDISYSSITSLPADLQVGGALNLSYTKITSLPADLKVGGTLDLSYTSITSLLAGLQVGGALNLSYTKITSLPADLKVGGAIYSFKGDKSQVPMHLRNKLK